MDLSKIIAPNKDTYIELKPGLYTLGCEYVRGVKESPSLSDTIRVSKLMDFRPGRIYKVRGYTVGPGVFICDLYDLGFIEDYKEKIRIIKVPGCLSVLFIPLLIFGGAILDWALLSLIEAGYKYWVIYNIIKYIRSSDDNTR